MRNTSPTARTKNPDRSYIPILLGGIVGAMTLWPMSYTTLNNSTSTVALGWAIFCTVAGIYLGAVTERAISQIALLTCGGVAIALGIRIVIDCTIDPTNHNLWPFEFVWMMIVCFPTSAIGGFLGRKLLSQR